MESSTKGKAGPHTTFVAPSSFRFYILIAMKASEDKMPFRVVILWVTGPVALGIENEQL